MCVVFLFACKKKNDLNNPFNSTDNCQHTFLSEEADTIYPNSLLPFYPGSVFNYKYKGNLGSTIDSNDIVIEIDPDWHLIGIPLTSTHDSCGALFERKAYVPKMTGFLTELHYQYNHEFLLGLHTTDGLLKPKNILEIDPFEAANRSTLTIDTIPGTTTIEGIDYQNITRSIHTTKRLVQTGKFEYTDFTRTEYIYFAEDIGIIYYLSEGQNFGYFPSLFSSYSYSLTSYFIND